VNVNPNSAQTCTYNNWDGSIPYKPVAANLAGPNYLKPTQGSGFASSPILPPRIFKLGVRWKF
jgi:hypothetical protein